MDMNKIEELFVRFYLEYICEALTTEFGNIGVAAEIVIKDVDMNKLKTLAKQHQEQQQKNTDNGTPHIFSDDLDKFYKEKQNDDETAKADN